MTLTIYGDFNCRGTALELAAEIATILDLREREPGLRLEVPPIRSNTALACAALAAAGGDADRLRRRLFAAVWTHGCNLSDPAELRRLGANGVDMRLARRWQDDFAGLPEPITPTLVLPDGDVSRGLGALARLAHLATAVPTKST
ncbi:MAG TPA: hypothetical protein VJ804_03970 [Acidimicrobiales bacterium]|nr:hypothetical protein [Acidimicrobiales bacterium]